ncbi:carboxypeptidase-like regulatory domain-containing protein [Winogradskyella litoriviva]|uniref:Carboxypeptidase-like regulatory domain-containing protein n=1 Tax=Winogradskyella litoriviva TaxID=1220182 RepID=A0ABX2E3Q4_9FLAO|nr:carboxypeptidase-like regulatory domain-containing protein [Winogradskyella litoriviva]NRD22930.1 carboxypeptidase-like regulatory domain-containing protein [Winogradskyella litoriviva]
MSKKLTVTYLILFFCTAVICAQGADQLECRIVDSENKYPVSFATVQFKGEANGLVANAEGSFRLPAMFKQKNKQIIISSIGYETQIIEVNTFSYKAINIIYLKPKIENLDAVFITSGKTNQITKESSLTIINKAISKIPLNYPNQPHAYMGYYRDYQIVNGQYYNLNEGILEDFDSGFQTNKIKYKDNQTVLYSYSQNNNFNQDTLLLNSIYGKSKVLDAFGDAKLETDIRNELEILNIHNPIRNYNKSSFSFIYVLKDDFINNHDFMIPKGIFLDDILLYEIEFKTKEDIQSKFKAKGKIYVSKSNYAIYKLDYRVYENENYIVNRKRKMSFGSNEQADNESNTLFKINIEYKEVAGKMYLNYMTFNNRFIIKEPNPFKEETFDLDSDTNAFYFTFNKPVDESSIKRKSRFKLYFRTNKLIIRNIKLIDEKTIKVSVLDWAAGTKTEIADTKPEDFTYKLKRIKDISGMTIYKASKLLGFQFREFFTQEIFENKSLPQDVIFVNKTLPLYSSKLNSKNFDANKYWVNSPLQQTEEVKR